MSEEKIHTRRPRHATEEEIRYIMQIQGVLNNTKEEEEKHILINNINEELRGTEVSLASNKKTSFVIQSILENCTRDQVRLFLSYSKDFAVHMFIQTYASHVMQTALEMANKFLTLSVEEEKGALDKRVDGEPLEPLVDLINVFIENLLGHIMTVCTDTNGSHVIRYILCILMGCPHRYGDIKKHIEKGSLEKKTNKVLLDTFDEARSAILFAIAEMQPQDREYLLKNKNSCFVVQLLMTYLPPEQRTKLAHILMEVEDEERAVKLMKDLMVDACGSRSLEVMIRAASEENVNRFFKSVVLENITEYAGNPRSNYVVQMFLSRVTDKALVEEAYAALDEHLEALYNSNNRGILLQLLNACRRCKTKEEECMERVVSILKRVLEMEKDANYGEFLEKCLSFEKEGGRIKMNEVLGGFVFELMQLSSPLCNLFILPMLKWELDVLLRVYLSCSLGKKMILYIVSLMDAADEKTWRNVLRQLKPDNAPTILNDVNEEKQKEMKLCLSRLRLRLRREKNVKGVKEEKKEKKEKKEKAKKERKEKEKAKEKNPAPSGESSVKKVAQLFGY